MSTKTKRRFSAWLLLSVFMPMLLFSSLHVHQQTASQQDCTECVNHVPHGGHLSFNTLDVHDCVLCKFTSLSFLLVAGLVAGAVAREHADRTSPRLSFRPAACLRTLSLRAPPRV